MCGFIGFYGSKNVDLTLAAKTILHRGPDMQNVTCGKGWKIAFNRLSILDLSESGMQPFSFDKTTVIMNGEIYNYRELIAEHKAEFSCQSGSDVEIIPFLYRKYGLQFLQKLNGMFAMAIIDERKNKYYLVRDRYGEKPIFYKQSGDTIYFASELKALKCIVPIKPDKINLALNMSCWYLVQPLTPYENVYNVSPGCYLEFDGKTAVEHRWYDPNLDVLRQSSTEIKENFMSLYRRSVQLKLRSDVPVGIALSGGLDSSSMAYLAQGISPHNFVAFTASITDKETWGRPTDIENPKRLCSDLGIRQISTNVNFDFWDRNIVDIVSNYDKIFLDSGALVFYALSEAAKANGVKVMLSGVGGDELFGGYPWQSQMRSLPRFFLKYSMGKISSKKAKNICGLLSTLGSGRIVNRIVRNYRLMAQFHVWHAQSLSSLFVPYMRDMGRSVSERIESCSEKYFNDSIRAVDGDLYNQVHYANIFTVVGHQNYMTDMAGMRHSVENRSPLLDHNVFEYMMTVADTVKTQGGPKSLMRDILSDFLPPYITYARKSGPTMPVDKWFSDVNIRKSAINFLLRNKGLIADYLSSDIVSCLQHDSVFHSRAGAMRLFALISFVIWAKINIENSISDHAISFADIARCDAH